MMASLLAWDFTLQPAGTYMTGPTQLHLHSLLSHVRTGLLYSKQCHERLDCGSFTEGQLSLYSQFQVLPKILKKSFFFFSSLFPAMPTQLLDCSLLCLRLSVFFPFLFLVSAVGLMRLLLALKNKLYCEPCIVC